MMNCEITTADGSDVFASLQAPLTEIHREADGTDQEDFKPSLTLRVGHGSNSGSSATLTTDHARELGTMLLRAVAVMDARARL
jgi:hypothetical protein